MPTGYVPQITGAWNEGGFQKMLTAKTRHLQKIIKTND